MLVRIYWSMWTVIMLAALVVYAIGSFTMFTAVVFGFLAFGMTFMGMMSVLPGMVTHAHPPRTKAVKAEPNAIEAVRQPALETFRILKSA